MYKNVIKLHIPHKDTFILGIKTSLLDNFPLTGSLYDMCVLDEILSDCWGVQYGYIDYIIDSDTQNYIKATFKDIKVEDYNYRHIPPDYEYTDQALQELEQLLNFNFMMTYNITP